jgi:hypothetical protein
MSYFTIPKDGLLRFTDAHGVDRPCVVVFVTREFGTTRVREHYRSYLGEKYAGSSLQIPSAATYHQRLDIKGRFYPPKPKIGGRFEDMVECFFLYIYFDDLILDRKSGEFRIRDPLQSPLSLRTDEAVRAIVDQRRHVPEFCSE